MTSPLPRASLPNRLFRVARSVAIASGKRLPYLHTLARGALAAVRGRSYRHLCAKTPIEPATVMFESYSGRGCSCSPSALCEALLNDPAYRDHTLIWALRPPLAAALLARGGYRVLGLEAAETTPPSPLDLDRDFSPELLESLKRVTVVASDSKEYSRAYARASRWIVNCRIPAHLIPRAGQAMLQTWHGTPLKRLGFDIPTTAAGSKMYRPRDWRFFYELEGSRLTWLLSPSPFASRALSSAFNLTALGKDGAVVEEGYPRNDALHCLTDASVERVRTRLGIPEGKCVVLYAPTWRDDSHQSSLGYTFESPLDFDELHRQLGEGYVVLFRAHYLIANSFDFTRHANWVIDVSSVNDVNELYAVSDILVTDYSSVFFDFANLRRPIVFYLYDLERYEGEVRGFYLPLETLPGPIARTQDELATAVHAAADADELREQRLRSFAAEYAPRDDGHASERVLARVMPDRA